MNWEAWFTLAVITVAVLVLTRDLISPAVTFTAAVVVLLVADVLTPEEAFQGFANPAPITVAALYVLARAVERSGALQPIVKVTLGTGRSLRLALARLTIPVAAASAFLNNTPIIAMLTPQVEEWADQRGDSASRYLMPLSFAAILGGMTTLIGTSTNLVVSGLLQADGYEPFTMFELTGIALPIAVVALAINVLVAPSLLPDRIPPAPGGAFGWTQLLGAYDRRTGRPAGRRFRGRCPEGSARDDEDRLLRARRRGRGPDRPGKGAPGR